MKKRLLPVLILVVYCAILIKVMVFKDLPMIRIGHLMLNFGGTQEGPANLVPFKTILPYLLGEKGLLIAGLNIGGNIVLLVPVGFLVPLIFRNMTWKKSLALALATGLTIEIMQEILHVGIFDIDDVILNGLGVMIGYWAFTFLTNKVPSAKSRKIIIISATVFVIAAVGIFYVVAVNPGERRRLNAGPAAATIQPNRSDSGNAPIPEGADPCSGTGGTGQIISVADHSLTIRKNDGVNELIHLTNQTSMRNSTGPVSESDLKTGYRVTVVVEDNHTATVVLICNGSRPDSTQ